MGKSWENHGILFLNFCGNPDMGCILKHNVSMSGVSLYAAILDTLYSL